MYDYKVALHRVIDGDTIDFIIDLGFDVSIKIRIRLSRINAYEVKGKEKKKGLKAKRYVNWILKRADAIEIQTERKRGKFDRYIGEVMALHRNNWFCLNDRLVDKKLAKYRKY